MLIGQLLINEFVLCEWSSDRGHGVGGMGFFGEYEYPFKVPVSVFRPLR